MTQGLLGKTYPTDTDKYADQRTLLENRTPIKFPQSMQVKIILQK
jgi:hypothetical protein